MTDAYDLGAKIRDSLYVVIDHYAAALPLGVKAIQGGGMPGSASKEAPPPVPLHVLDVRAMCCSRLAGWARVVLEERQLTHSSLQAGDALGLARFLMVHAGWLGEHVAGQDAADEIDTSARELRALALPDPPQGVVVCNQCPVLVEAGTCGGTVRATPGEPIRCQRCGTTGALDWWHTLMFGDTELAPLVTARDLVGIIANQTGHVIDPATIRKWVERGKVERSGSDEKGRPLYDHVSVIALIRMGKVA